MIKKMTTEDNNSNATHFGRQANVPVLSHAHCPMEGVQGFTWCHWMQPSGKYLHHVVLLDNWVVCKKNDKKHTCWLFWWPWQCTSTIPSTLLHGGGSRLWWKPLVVATGQVLWAIVGLRTTFSDFSKFFHCFPPEKRLKMMSRPLITMGVWHINQIGRSYRKWSDTWLGRLTQWVTFKWWFSKLHHIAQK